MLGETPVSEVETALSAAMTACLRFMHEFRPVFIANHLLGIQWPPVADGATAEGIAAAEETFLQKEKPEDLDSELAELSLTLKAAVNCAARQPSADDTLRRIADYLLRHHTAAGSGLQLDGDEELAAPPPPPAPSSQMAEWSKKLAAIPMAPAAAPAVAPPSPELFNKVSSSSPRATTPKGRMDLGKTPSVVGPSLIGAIEEAKALRSKHEVDQSVIKAAMRNKDQFEGLDEKAPRIRS